MSQPISLTEARRQADRIARTARRILIALLILGALIAGLLWHPAWAPRPAHAAVLVQASPVHGKVDVCTTGLAKSWTKRLERKANRAFRQRIDVHRRSENHLSGCDVVIWRGGHVAIDYLTGEPAPNPRYHVQVGSLYNLATVEINVGTITPKAKRPATIIAALREAGIR